ncbi:MAG: hypothetical protein AAGH15_23390 [Myxococcota bacterium]
MLKRLGLGLLKGLVIGGALGAGLHFGLGWTTATGILGFALAMGSGAIAGVFTGKPPWKEGGAIEGGLKAVFGAGLGALAYWLGTKYGAIGLPLDIPAAANASEVVAGTPWTEIPLTTVAAVAGAYGTLVELDNTPSGGDGARHPKARVEVPAEAEGVTVPAERERERERGA